MLRRSIDDLLDDETRRFYEEMHWTEEDIRQWLDENGLAFNEYGVHQWAEFHMRRVRIGSWIKLAVLFGITAAVIGVSLWMVFG